MMIPAWLSAFRYGVIDGIALWDLPPPNRHLQPYRFGWHLGRGIVVVGYPLLILCGIWAWWWVLGG